MWKYYYYQLGDSDSGDSGGGNQSLEMMMDGKSHLDFPKVKLLSLFFSRSVVTLDASELHEWGEKTLATRRENKVETSTDQFWLMMADERRMEENV